MSSQQVKKATACGISIYINFNLLRNRLWVIYMSKDMYGVKLIYKYVVHSLVPQELYEEQILKIAADSFDEAYQKTDEYIKLYLDKYTNINGDSVEISLYKEVDCFKCYEEENSVQEVYSGFLKLDDNALKLITTPCETDKLQILHHE